jgi:hypothetical protein
MDSSQQNVSDWSVCHSHLGERIGTGGRDKCPHLHRSSARLRHITSYLHFQINASKTPSPTKSSSQNKSSFDDRAKKASQGNTAAISWLEEVQEKERTAAL